MGAKRVPMQTKGRKKVLFGAHVVSALIIALLLSIVPHALADEQLTDEAGASPDKAGISEAGELSAQKEDAEREPIVSDDNPVNENVTPAPASLLNGWVQHEGEWYYYINGLMVRNSWQMDSTDWCYLGADGKAYRDRWAKLGDSSGVFWYYFSHGGSIVRNTWQMDSTDWCYLDEAGHAYEECWAYLKDSSGWNYYYFKAGGNMKRSGWQSDSGGMCYLDAYGHPLVNRKDVYIGYPYDTAAYLVDCDFDNQRHAKLGTVRTVSGFNGSSTSTTVSDRTYTLTSMCFADTEGNVRGISKAAFSSSYKKDLGRARVAARTTLSSSLTNGSDNAVIGSSYMENQYAVSGGEGMWFYAKGRSALLRQFTCTSNFFITADDGTSYSRWSGCSGVLVFDPGLPPSPHGNPHQELESTETEVLDVQ